MKKSILWATCGVAAVGVAALVWVGLGKKDATTIDTNISPDTSNNSIINTETTAKKADHKIYKYVKMSSSVGSGLLYSAAVLFGDVSEVSSGDIYYKPCIVAEFDTETGKAIKATFYAFFLDYDDDEWVNKALEKYENSSSEAKTKFTNISKGRVNDNVSYLSADLDVNSYIFTQFIDTYIIKSQDIEKYKDEIFFSRLYNYSSEPPHSEGENFFEESLEGIRIEWSDGELYPLTGEKIVDTGITDVSSANVSLQDFVGQYRGFNPFYVTDWNTYAMSEDVDRSSLSFAAVGDDYAMKDIIIDSTSPKIHKNLDDVVFRDNEMTYYLDDGQEDLLDCLKNVSADDWTYLLCKRQKDGQLVVTMDNGEITESFAVVK